ncbi:MAG: hypothetical protein AB1921_16015 [Thermodesulfobacteriota bacterium]
MPGECSLYLEYQVPPPEGDGVASHTDLMVLSDQDSLAVEAKWTEPRYETVKAWRDKGKDSENRRKVLKGWLGLLQRQAGRELHMEDFSNAIYQMVHRAASACAAGARPRLAYLVFKLPPDHPDHPERTASIQQIKDDLKHLWELLGSPKSFPFYLVEQPLSFAPAFESLSKLPKADERTAEQVKAALAGENWLFRFAGYSVAKIGEST